MTTGVFQKREDELFWQELIRRIRTTMEPEKIILFGSKARGDAGTSSDIDLFIIAQSDLPRYKRSVPFYRALLGLGVAKDIISVYAGGGGRLENGQLQSGSNGLARGQGVICEATLSATRFGRSLWPRCQKRSGHDGLPPPAAQRGHGRGAGQAQVLPTLVNYPPKAAVLSLA